MIYGANTFGGVPYGTSTTIANSVASEVQLLSPSAVLDFFELDATNIGDSKLYFHSGISGLGNNVVWQGITYTRYPIEADGFEYSGSGTLPRPKLKAANITGALSAVASRYQDLIGAKIIRRRTFYKYLDAVNFDNGNVYADPNVGFPDEVWFIDRKSAENPIFIEFELAAAFDVTGVQLPRRQCIQNTCTWKYRGAECGYTGGAVADHNDVATTILSKDKCGKRLGSCKLRFGETAELPFGGFPGVGLIR